jgi:hypothetical protein
MRPEKAQFSLEIENSLRPIRLEIGPHMARKWTVCAAIAAWVASHSQVEHPQQQLADWRLSLRRVGGGVAAIECDLHT